MDLLHFVAVGGELFFDGRDELQQQQHFSWCDDLDWRKDVFFFGASL